MGSGSERRHQLRSHAIAHLRIKYLQSRPRASRVSLNRPGWLWPGRLEESGGGGGERNTFVAVRHEKGEEWGEKSRR